MARAININDLLNKQKIEPNRIEFKKGWNPGSIYHRICAFANDSAQEHPLPQSSPFLIIQLSDILVQDGLKIMIPTMSTC